MYYTIVSEDSELTGSQGPVMAYMKKVTDATTDVGYGDGWFKIQHAGLLNSASKFQAPPESILAEANM